MAVEDDPKFAEWQRAQKHLILVREALRRGDAKQQEVDRVQAEYDRLSREIDLT
ncbi:MAG TPA: hypothetical protein VL331_10035 [Croceibacterium sp.]|nr:hypothetical protein [Croceibacterium sp.]